MHKELDNSLDGEDSSSPLMLHAVKSTSTLSAKQRIIAIYNQITPGSRTFQSYKLGYTNRQKKAEPEGQSGLVTGYKRTVADTILEMMRDSTTLVDLWSTREVMNFYYLVLLLRARRSPREGFCVALACICVSATPNSVSIL